VYGRDAELQLAPREAAQGLATKLEQVQLTFSARVGDEGKLFGSVTSADIAEFLKTKGFEIDRRKLILPEPIKTIGEHDVPLKLHREVTAPLKVKVVKEGAETATA